MSIQCPKMLDVVELLSASGRWPAGTVGTAVDVKERLVLVEISDDTGAALDFIAVPHEVLVAHRSAGVAKVES
jgi:hypothetical protein